MKKFLAIVALGTVLAAPAFAQQAANGRQDNRAFHQQSSSRVHPYSADRYTAPQYENNNNANPDFQLGGER
jgi:Ni/Co efflux regulator RcnB